MDLANKKMRILDIYRGKGRRSHIVYAKLVTVDGDLVISATLDYIVAAVFDRGYDVEGFRPASHGHKSLPCPPEAV